MIRRCTSPWFPMLGLVSQKRGPSRSCALCYLLARQFDSPLAATITCTGDIMMCGPQMRADHVTTSTSMPVDLDPLTATNSLGDTFWSGGALCNMCLPRSDANNRIQAAVALWGLQSTLVSKPGKSHAVVCLGQPSLRPHYGQCILSEAASFRCWIRRSSMPRGAFCDRLASAARRTLAGRSC